MPTSYRGVLLWTCLTMPLATIAEEPPSPAMMSFGADFWRHWGDGRAEVATYDLTLPRYGQPRRGVAVTIFVTETFSDSLRVKAEPGRHRESDTYPVMKLNLIQDFATGVYDYNLMTSAFVALSAIHHRPAGSPSKVSFSSQEWCGHVYEQLLFDSRSVRFARHSYFDGEADDSGSIDYPSDGVPEDFVLLWARGLCSPDIAPGESRRLTVLTSLQAARLQHVPLEWQPSTAERSGSIEPVTVPAGTFQARQFTVVIHGGRTWRVHVEDAFPHRIAQWECSDGTTARLLRCERIKYWEMSKPGFEQTLEQIGLSPRPPRTP